VTVLLVRFPWSAEAARALAPLATDVFRALAGGEGYAYVDETAGGDRVRARAGAWPGASLARLSPLLDVAGASAGADARFHYIVETDVRPAHEADFNAWYDTEHMPGLARVPGAVRARRFRNDAAHPRYHACYDLVTAETLGSPPWLAVRATPWSDRVRPAFHNTKRTMFERVR
jgi:hypothetical protein